MKLSEYCKEMRVGLPIKLIGKIVGKHPNYLNELWKNGEEKRVIEYIAKAEIKFKSICK